MLAKENRLKKTKDIEDVWKKGKGQREQGLFIKILKNDLAVSRFAFVVGLKVSKKAVVRNKLKRQLREIVRARLPKIKPGLDALIVALPGLEVKTFRDLQEIIDKLFKKMRIYA